MCIFRFWQPWMLTELNCMSFKLCTTLAGFQLCFTLSEYRFIDRNFIHIFKIFCSYTYAGKINHISRTMGYKQKMVFWNGCKSIFTLLMNFSLKNCTMFQSPSESSKETPGLVEEISWADEQTDVHHLTEDNFETFLNEHDSVLVMFYAPCKQN